MNSGAIWIIAAFFGFLVWWPIGVAFLTAITVTAISQQLTGYMHREQQIRYNKSIGDVTHRPPMKQINQIEARAITHRTPR